MLLTSGQLGPSVDGPLPSSSATALPCFKRGQCIKDGFPAESGKSMVLGSACKPASVHCINIHHLSMHGSLREQLDLTQGIRQQVGNALHWMHYTADGPGLQ